VFNEQSQDVFCKRIAVRVIFDDPKDYLETGEVVNLISDKYLRSKQSLGIGGESQKLDGHIRSVSVIDPDCTSASIFDFCSFAEKTEKERTNLDRIAKVVGATNCSDLANKVGGFRESDLQPDDDIRRAPFRFIPIATRNE
jgi:hypothetical protein